MVEEQEFHQYYQQRLSIISKFSHNSLVAPGEILDFQQQLRGLGNLSTNYREDVTYEDSRCLRRNYKTVLVHYSLSSQQNQFHTLYNSGKVSKWLSPIVIASSPLTYSILAREFFREIVICYVLSTEIEKMYLIRNQWKQFVNVSLYLCEFFFQNDSQKYQNHWAWWTIFFNERGHQIISFWESIGKVIKKKFSPSNTIALFSWQ